MNGEICPKCGNARESVECWQCAGAGGRNGDDLMEEDPLWYSPDDWEDCDICNGEGYWWMCHTCANKEEKR